MGDRSVVDESTPLAPDHPATYPRTKARGERKALERAGEVGIELTVVPPSMVYGPGHGLWTVGMFRNVREGKPVFMAGAAHGRGEPDPGRAHSDRPGVHRDATSRRRFALDKARELLGLEPRVGLDEGMKRTARWLEDQGLLTS